VTGSFILIDPLSNATVAAGMIREDSVRVARYADRSAMCGRASSAVKRSLFKSDPSEIGHRARSLCYSPS